MNTLRKTIATAAVIATATLGTAMATPTSASASTPGCSACTNLIWNSPANGFRGGLGVIKDNKGSGNNYAKGLYDAVLASNAYTWFSPLSWTHAEGFYLGPGYCMGLWRSNDGGGPDNNDWAYQGFYPSGQYFIDEHTSYKVEAEPC